MTAALARRRHDLAFDCPEYISDSYLLRRSGKPESSFAASMASYDAGQPKGHHELLDVSGRDSLHLRDL
jgi:hypothetical protein